MLICFGDVFRHYKWTLCISWGGMVLWGGLMALVTPYNKGMMIAFTFLEQTFFGWAQYRTYTNGQQGRSNHVVATCSLTLTDLTLSHTRSCVKYMLTLLPITYSLRRIHTARRASTRPRNERRSRRGRSIRWWIFGASDLRLDSHKRTILSRSCYSAAGSDASWSQQGYGNCIARRVPTWLCSHCEGPGHQY